MLCLFLENTEWSGLHVNCYFTAEPKIAKPYVTSTLSGGIYWGRERERNGEG